MFREAREGIANAITSDEFIPMFILSAIMILVGFALGVGTTDDLNKKACNEMGITEALQYPYCRTYLEEQLKEIGN